MRLRRGTMRAATVDRSRTQDVVVEEHDHKKGSRAGFDAD
jgi:hypothetical protein